MIQQEFTVRVRVLGVTEVLIKEYSPSPVEYHTSFVYLLAASINVVKPSSDSTCSNGGILTIPV